MPELPEVETVRRGLAAVMEGQPIVDVLVRRGDAAAYYAWRGKRLPKRRRV